MYNIVIIRKLHLMNNIPSQNELATNFKNKIIGKSKIDPEKYNWEYIYELYLRYIQSVTDKTNYILWNDQKNISPRWVIKKLDKDFKDYYWIKNYSISYEKYRNVMMNIWTITESYNTEDGQIRWLEDNKFDIHLWNFYNIIPKEVKDKMTVWQYMILPLKQAVDIRNKLKNIQESYNTEDGQIRWLEDNDYQINLWHFYSIIPKEIKNKMTEWKRMNLPLKQAVDIRNKLINIDESYNTEDGQIHWLEDNKYEIHLWNFYSIIPKEIKNMMTEWKNMSLPLKQAVDIRNKLINIDESYNTEDGYIRWLVDNKYEINLWSFYSIVPIEIKDKMTKWKYIKLPLKIAIELKEKLKNIDESYNTEDGQIRWLEDNDYQIHLWSFYSIITKEVKEKMTEWQIMDLSLNITIELREKLKNIDESYNTEDGQIRWLEDNKSDINLWQFYSIISNEVKDKMTKWKKIELTFIEAQKKYKNILRNITCSSILTRTKK